MAFAGIIAGLGNPGKNYQHNRHNIGFQIVDRLCETYASEAFKDSKFNTLLAQAHIGGKNWLLAKPQSYMNLCGAPMAKISEFYKMASADLWVIHDEIDLPFAKIRTKFGGGSAGHNGLKNITQHVGADYHRLRIGVGRPTHASHEDNVSNHVLGDFSASESADMRILIASISEHIGDWLNGDEKTFISKINPQTQKDC